ncbi:MAG TPA: universal stress protein [Planctomicrobium sp.]|nr:universal stress protein [Planctomicrobium sp.]
MSFQFEVPQFVKRQQRDLSRILVHFTNQCNGASLISSAVKLAQLKQATLRGMTIIDTTRLLDDLSQEGSAAFAAYETERMSEWDKNRDEIRSNFSFSCLAAGLDFDLCSKQGNTLKIVANESRFQDLLITSATRQKKPVPVELSAASAIEVIRTAHCPTLVLRDQPNSIERVLMVHDGSKESSRAFSSFHSQCLFPNATFRLITIQNSQADAERLLSEQYHQFEANSYQFEHGYLVGKPSTLLPQYIENWEADLVVYGVKEKRPLVDKMIGQTSELILKKTSASLYSA